MFFLLVLLDGCTEIRIVLHFFFQDMKENGMVRTNPLTLSGMSNRDKQQKLNQVAAELAPD